MIETTLSDMLYPRTNGFADTISGMVAKGQNALVSLDDQDSIVNHPLIWPVRAPSVCASRSPRLHSLCVNWQGTTEYNSYANSDNVTTMVGAAAAVTRVDAARVDAALSCQVTYNDARVIEYNSKVGRCGLACIASSLQPLLLDQTWPDQLYKISWTLTPQASTMCVRSSFLPSTGAHDFCCFRCLFAASTCLRKGIQNRMRHIPLGSSLLCCRSCCSSFFSGCSNLL
jgi:hypothetical protein